MVDALAAWLASREPHDWAARSGLLVDAVRRVLPEGEVLRVLDLGTGAGSNLRYLVPRLGAQQEWLLVDKAAGVLQALAERTASWADGLGLRATVQDSGFTIDGVNLHCLVRLVERDLDLPLPDPLFADRHLVTASALLDLASQPWLAAVARHCRVHRSAALFALTYNGESSFDPPADGDDLARDLLNAHQRQDKGLGGPAAGPDAHTMAAAAFRREGFIVREARTDWDVSASASEFQRLLIEGLAGAAAEQQPDAATAMADWQRQRLAMLEHGTSRMIVGHYDLAAWPSAD